MNIYKGIAERWNPQKGLIVRLPKRGFITIPIDEISLYPLSKVDEFGIPLEVKSILGGKVVFCNKEDGTFSRKKVMQEDFKSIEIGDILKASVYAITNIGVFLHYRTLIIFCPIFEISNCFVKQANEYFLKGQKVEVMVTSKPNESLYIIGSYKDTFDDDPFQYAVGDTLVCKVTKVHPHIQAYFLEITPAVKGLLDIYNCPIQLKYGDKIIAIVKRITDKGIKVNFVKKLDS